MSTYDQTDGIPGQAISELQLANRLDDLRAIQRWLEQHGPNMPPAQLLLGAGATVSVMAYSTAEFRALGAWLGEDDPSMTDVTMFTGTTAFSVTRRFGTATLAIVLQFKHAVDAA